MVEFALVLPLFVLLLYGSIEVGLLFKTQGAYEEAAFEAVRVAAAAANATDADQQALVQLQTMLPAENLANIASVTIYDATASGAPIAPITATGSVTSTFYTIYTYRPGVGFVCPGTSTPPPCASGSSWNPAVRNTRVPSLDNIGLKIMYTYRSLTGFLPSYTSTQIATALVEPRTY